ncbi:hypothetical protein PSEUBRA_000245 [Kalmanozyma brasiliensis GHG001]|uniref:Uncharacterized protein n=1 Tax=Kalmanozyma brasiliensis (strain GHG001) TaxID=1365824 RepID=V5F2Z7_KALBG|nr:uncharacterized protein PSEUBRA_000245 [Kalmanozyma brasiliensis GHG001]EST09854.1 hypothetical protein PSEUBRA_000245 [Kalmanozyma brasiliensis GHG001]
MKLDQNPLGALRAKGRLLRRKSDRTRIQASSTVTCDGALTSPKLSQHRLSNDDLKASYNSSRSSSVDTFGHHHSHDHEDFPANSPVLLRGDKELHDPNFVRHNWEMMSGESTYPDNQLHIGRAASPHLTSRRSTLSSRTGSSRPSSRPSSRGSEAGGQHAPSFGLAVNAFSGLSSYAQAGSMGRAGGSRASSSTRGLQVEGSILRDEEAILDSDDSSDDEEDEDDSRYGSTPSAYQLSTSRRSSPTPQPLPSVHQTEVSPRSSAPSSPTLTHLQGPSYHRRRHWTVAEGSQASNGAGLHTLPGQMSSSSRSALLNERSLSQPA